VTPERWILKLPSAPTSDNDTPVIREWYTDRMTPLQVRLRRELLAEGLDPRDLDGLPEGVIPLGEVIDDVVDALERV
jgi:hypothetical protein